jgi:hypothetical protein
MRRFWVDFNDRTDQGYVPASPPSPVDVFLVDLHERVMAFDGDGNECPALVANIHGDDGWLELAVEWGEFARRQVIAGQGSLLDA